MNRKVGVAVASVILAIVATASWVGPVAAENAPRIIPAASDAYGKTYPEWFSIYWRWSLGTAQDPTQSTVGRVQLMPQPPEEFVSGSGTPEDPAVFVGQMALTLRPGTPFALPLLGLYGERYAGYPAVPDDDPALFTHLLDTFSASLTIDGKTIISDANQAAFYLPATFLDPIVTYPEPTSYGSVAAVWFQGINILSPPLPVGEHVIHLDGTGIVPGFFGTVYHNTWIVTVTSH
jgi:hypothetical protein